MLTELAAMLRPAGGGVHTVSTGKSQQLALQQALYDARDQEEVVHAWRMDLASVVSARVAVLGVPSDCGAGLVRGAAFGPSALRRTLLETEPRFRAMATREGVVDVGDVRTIPQLLSDEMLAPEQIAACQRALYSSTDPVRATLLPVSPLSITERVVRTLLTLNPTLRVFVLGGDHSVVWPVVKALAQTHDPGMVPWAIVQFDAHTDLLPERLGIRHCFATWAYHANDLLGRGGRLVQVGVRQSGHAREHWESTLGVRQFWADWVAAQGDASAIDGIVAHLHAVGVKGVYLSNDIDGTDAAFAPSTGAPEPAGLTPSFVRTLIRRVGDEFALLGADVVEVAPSVGAAEDARKTCEVGASYILDSLHALLNSRTLGDL